MLQPLCHARRVNVRTIRGTSGFGVASFPNLRTTMIGFGTRPDLEMPCGKPELAVMDSIVNVF